MLTLNKHTELLLSLLYFIGLKVSNSQLESLMFFNIVFNASFYTEFYLFYITADNINHFKQHNFTDSTRNSIQYLVHTKATNKCLDTAGADTLVLCIFLTGIYSIQSIQIARINSIGNVAYSLNLFP